MIDHYMDRYNPLFVFMHIGIFFNTVDFWLKMFYFKNNFF